MSISDAQYAAWLAADNKERTVLVEVKAFSGGAEVTRYFSDRGFVSAPTDTPANTAYDDILLSVPSFRSVLSEAFTGKSTVGYGELKVDNASGVRDSWLLDGWDGREVVMYLGDASWDKADYRVIFKGAVDDISAEGNRTLVLRIRDRQYLFDVPMLTQRIGGTDNAKDTPIPACYGEVKNVPAVLETASTHTYRVHDGAIQSIDAVYRDGKALTLTTDYTVDIANGRFSLTAAAAGTITADVKGSKTGGTYVNTVADIAKRIITERTSVASGDIDSSAITQLNTDQPGVAGVFISSSVDTVLDALDFVLGKAGCYYAINRLGVVFLAQFKAPAGTPVVTVTDDDVKMAGISLVRRIVPAKSVRVGYARFYSFNDYGFDPTLTDNQIRRLQQEYLVAFASTGATGFLLALDGPVSGSPLVASSDAATEATRRATLWGSLRRVFELRGFLAAQQVKLGDTIALDLARYGLSGGVLARVVGLTESVTKNAIELEVFL